MPQTPIAERGSYCPRTPPFENDWSLGKERKGAVRKDRGEERKENLKEGKGRSREAVFKGLYATKFSFRCRKSYTLIRSGYTLIWRLQSRKSLFCGNYYLGLTKKVAHYSILPPIPSLSPPSLPSPPLLTSPISRSFLSWFVPPLARAYPFIFYPLPFFKSFSLSLIRGSGFNTEKHFELQDSYWWFLAHFGHKKQYYDKLGLLPVNSVLHVDSVLRVNSAVCQLITLYFMLTVPSVN